MILCFAAVMAACEFGGVLAREERFVWLRLLSPAMIRITPGFATLICPCSWPSLDPEGLSLGFLPLLSFCSLCQKAKEVRCAGRYCFSWPTLSMAFSPGIV